MTTEEVRKEILKYDWERWLERPYGVFELSLFQKSITRRYIKKIGIDAELLAFLYQDNIWYESSKVMKIFVDEIRKNLKDDSAIFEITESCKKFHQAGKEKIFQLIRSNHLNIENKLAGVVDILTLAISHIWLAHGLEDLYDEKLHREIPKFFQGDIEKIIGDIIFPTKKNAPILFEEALLAGVDLEEIQKKFAWIKARDAFTEGFTVKELKEQKNSLRQKAVQKKISKIKIPVNLRSLIDQARELVYYRNYRTDVFYELMYFARPIFKEIAKKNGLRFRELRNYSVYDFIEEKPIKYPENPTFACFRGQAAVFDKPIFIEKQIYKTKITGAVAFSGKTEGTVKIVKDVSDLNKVKKGDILVTQMTFPAFIMAMRLANAFVTDEGGITCHAAIVAREMKKPCVIGTKIATKVLKDGDIVEVDANRGVVKIIK